jgi:hypothetical protein
MKKLFVPVQINTPTSIITWGFWYWPMALTIAAVVLGVLFFPAEIYAIATNHGNTLSDFSRYELGVQTALGKQTIIHTVAWWSSFVIWLGFVSWITLHIWFDMLG